jgi:Tol biopolymer transport system component
VGTKGRLLLVVLCLALTACSSARLPAQGSRGNASCGPSEAAPLLPGKLLETGNATLELWERGHRTPIACVRNAPIYFTHPVFAPDGKAFAYVTSTAPTTLAQDWGDDIYTANTDVSGARLVLKHDAPGAQIDSLAWAPDGQSLIYGAFRVQYDSAGRTASAIYAINRFDLSTGAITTLIHNASQASVSPDGKYLVFVSYPSSDLSVSALAVADLDGSNPHQILKGQNGFQSFFAPHLSPDGASVVFAAIGGPLTGSRAPASHTPPGQSPGTITPPARALQRIWERSKRVFAPGASADGSPYEVWVARLDGSAIHPVANLREDLPYPQWSADGKQILFLGAAALYLANADGSGTKQIDKGVAHGQIDWYQR